MRIRPLDAADLPRLPALLNAAFAEYRDITSFRPEVIELFRLWLWSSPNLSVAWDAPDGRLGGVVMAGARTARHGGVPLRAVHLGPVAVARPWRGRGVGRAMIETLRLAAGRDGFDYLTLTTEAAHAAHRLYARSGFQVLEAFQTRVRLLAAPPRPPTAALRVRSGTWDGTDLGGAGRPGTIREEAPAPAPIPWLLRPRIHRCGEAAVATMRWPVLSRGGDGTREAFATQVVRRVGSGPRLHAAVQTAAIAARGDCAACLYALPSAGNGMPGFRAAGSPVVYRMLLPLSAAAENAAARARGYDEACPAP